MENAINVINHLSPVINPSNGGNIKFPAPKNIANKAKPTMMQSFNPFFIEASFV